MAVKTITIKKEVYEKLLTIKGKNESFSKLLDRLANYGDSIKILEMMLGKVEFKDKEALLREIYEKRAEKR